MSDGLFGRATGRGALIKALSRAYLYFYFPLRERHTEKQKRRGTEKQEKREKRSTSVTARMASSVM